MKALFALLLAITTASATDLKPSFVAKAPPAVGCTVTSCVGLFVGGTMSQAGGNFDVIGTGLTGLAQNGFGLGGQVGYEFFSNQFYFAGLVHLEDDMSLNAVPGTSFSDRLTYGVCGRAGYSLAGIFGSATTSGVTPTLPQSLLNALMTPYVNVCEDKRHNQPSIATGAGIEALLAANAQGRSAWTLNVDYLHYNYNQGGSAGSLAGLPIAQTTDNVIKAGVSYHFGL